MKWTNEQQLALKNTPSNVLLSAGAGSGKTAVLTEKVYRMIKDGINPSEMLVLTFTEAVAFEMKERIKNKIKLDPLMKNRAEEVESAHIETFDAFYLFILKKYGKFLNINSDVSIVEESIMEYKKKNVLDSIFDNYYETNSLFREFIELFCIKSDKKLKEYILSLSNVLQQNQNRDNIIKNYKETFLKENEYTNNFNILIEKEKEELNNLFLNYIIPIENTDYVNKEEIQFDQLMLKKGTNFIEAVNSYKCIRAAGKCKIDSEKDKAGKDIFNNALKEIKKFYAGVSKPESEFKNDYNNYKYVELIFKIVEDLDEKLFEFKKTINGYTFQDITNLAMRLVKLDYVKKDILEDLKFILVDEYQDTNDFQEELLTILGRNNVFMVGDIKQSIYKFRNANCINFQNKYERYSLQDDGIKLDMSYNFRSHPKVIEQINSLFSEIMTKEKGGANYKKEHLINAGNDFYNPFKGKIKDAGINKIIYKTEEEINEQERSEYISKQIAYDIINKINNKFLVLGKDGNLRPCNFSDFVVLGITKSKFITISKVFEDLNIPSTVYADDLYENTCIFLTIKSLFNLYYYSSKLNYDVEKLKYYYISVKRSFLYAEYDDVIYSQIKNGNYLNDDIFSKISYIREGLKDPKLSELLYRLFEEFDFYKKILNLRFLDKVYSTIDNVINIIEYFDDNGKSIDEFIIYINDLEKFKLNLKSADPYYDERSVRVMSVHKSKGLEFNIIYFLDSNKKIIKNKNTLLFSNDYGLFLPINYNNHNNFLLRLAKNKYNEEDYSENMRLFYVALTRCKQTFYYFEFYDAEYFNTSSSKARTFNELFSLLKDVNVLKTVDEPIILNNVESNSLDLAIKEFKLDLDTSKVKSKASKELIYLDEDIKKKLDFGTTVHKYLECLDFETLNLDFVKDLKIKRILEKFIKLPIIELLKEGKIYKEYEFFDNLTNIHGIIDILSVYEDKVIICDYKLKNIEEEAYDEQLKIYGKYIERVFDKKVELYLISILTGDIEEVANEK